MSGRVKRDTHTPRASSRAVWLGGILIVLAGGCTYWNSLGGTFTWDDQTSVLTNQTIRRLWPLSVPLSPPPETPVSGRPVANLSFAINYRIGGLDVTGYHVWSVVVHLMCALLLFGIVRRTLARLGSGTAGAEMRWATETALIVALLWMLHPLQSEVVNYVTQRTESMSGLFLFLTLYSAIRARHSVGANRWTAMAIAACALGMGTKESMVAAPLVVILYDRVFEFGSIRDAIYPRRRLYMGLAATWLGLAALQWRTERSTVGASATMGAWTYLLNQAEMIVTYLRLTFWPRGLVLDYGLPRQVLLRDVAPQAAAVLAALGATVGALARWPKLGFLGAVFFLALAPTSSIVPITSEVGAERRMYVPLAAIAALAVVGGRLLLERLVARLRVRARTAWMTAIGATACVLVGLAALTAQRNTDYATPLSLWQTVVARRPHGRARMSYATELVAAGRNDEAMTELRQAVHDFPDARYALGTELVAAGRLDEGVSELQTFIRQSPGQPNRLPAHLLLGTVWLSQGKLAEAEKEFRSVLDRGDSTLARRGLANVASAHRAAAEAALEKFDAGIAAAHARDALRLDVADAKAHNLLGVALIAQRRVDQAITEFQTAVQLDSRDESARKNLARALSLPDPRPSPGR